jgi:hypothetical protein
MNRRWIPWMAVLLLLAVVFPAAAQDKKDKEKRESQLRTVRGLVIDKDENPVGSSVVFLKNLKTQTVKTLISDDDGRYRFSGLDPNVDYELHAEHNETASAKRTISSYDSRKDIVANLKLSKKREDK